jgi:hypothetical protein
MFIGIKAAPKGIMEHIDTIDKIKSSFLNHPPYKIRAINRKVKKMIIPIPIFFVI